MSPTARARAGMDEGVDVHRCLIQTPYAILSCRRLSPGDTQTIDNTITFKSIKQGATWARRPVLACRHMRLAQRAAIRRTDRFEQG